jgi:hypothetical protein
MGKPKYIETPEKMWELFEAYRDWCKSNPRYQYSLSNKTGARGLHSEIERTLIPHMFNLRRYSGMGIKVLKIEPSMVLTPAALDGTD